MCYGTRSYVRFKYERLSLFCFYCGRLGHSDSFYELRMEVRVETAEMGWDLSIRAQLREECERSGRRNNGEQQNWGVQLSSTMKNSSRGTLDPILGANLVGRGYHTKEGTGNGRGNMDNSLMEYDLEDEVIIGEEGRKRNRRDVEDTLAKEETNVLAEKSRRIVEVSHNL